MEVNFIIVPFYHNPIPYNFFFFNIQTKHLNYGFALKHILSKKTHLKKQT
jgi:hypothetical protein